MKFEKQFFYYFVSTFFFVAAILILTPGFYNNFWGTVGRKWFLEWRTAKDAPFVGRLVESNYAGILSHAGLLGWGDSARFDDSLALAIHQYEVYAASERFETNDFKTYNSTIGAQAAVFSVFDALTNFSPENNLLIFRSFTALFTAITLSALSLWIRSQIGFGAAIFAACFMACSEWLTLFGGSIYWSLWAIYFPLVALAFYLDNRQVENIHAKEIFLIVYLTVLLKTFFNGFEYITAALAMVFFPMIYYALINHWNLKVALKNGFYIFVSEFFAVLTALAVLIFQNIVVLGSVQNAVNYIVYSLEKRSVGNPDAFVNDAALSQSLRADTFMVIKKYVLGRAINLDLDFLLIRFPDWKLKNIEISYLSIFVIFIAFSILFIILRWLGKEKNVRLSYFILTTWLSLLAPLSWLFLFKAHAYLHLHLDFIVWQMPFTIFGFGMCGAIAQNVFCKMQAGVMSVARHL